MLELTRVDPQVMDGLCDQSREYSKITLQTHKHASNKKMEVPTTTQINNAGSDWEPNKEGPGPRPALTPSRRDHTSLKYVWKPKSKQNTEANANTTTKRWQITNKPVWPPPEPKMRRLRCLYISRTIHWLRRQKKGQLPVDYSIPKYASGVPR